MLRLLKNTLLALLLALTLAEGMTFCYSLGSGHKAARVADLLATLRPGQTTMDGARALFQAGGVDVGTLANACGDPKGPCDDLYAGADNHQYLVIRHPPLVFPLLPFPPFRPARFIANVYFINGVLDSTGILYQVGATTISYSRHAGDYNFRSSEWRYAEDGTVISIAVASSGPAFDIPFPHLDFSHMSTMRCVDARALWPAAPPPTTELHSQPACR